MALYTFQFKNGAKAAYIADQYMPKNPNAEMSPYAAIFTAIYDGEDRVGVVNETEVLFLHIDKRSCAAEIEVNQETVVSITKDEAGKVLVERRAR